MPSEPLGLGVMTTWIDRDAWPTPVRHAPHMHTESTPLPAQSAYPRTRHLRRAGVSCMQSGEQGCDERNRCELIRASPQAP